MQRADGQGVGATLTSAARQLLQGQAITETAITVTAQAVELGADPPAARRRRIEGIVEAEAACRGNGQGKAAIADFHLVVANRQAWLQRSVRVQLQLLEGAIFHFHPARTCCGKVRGQIQRLLHVGGNQWRQVPGIMGGLQCVQAGGNLLHIACRVAKSGQYPAHVGITDALRPAIGVSPIHGDARQVGKLLKQRISHGHAPVFEEVAG
ncbi:hypothetical protein D3C77_428920 [compost metagenome]